MIDFKTAEKSVLLEILDERKDSIIAIDTITSNTVLDDKQKWIAKSIPVFDEQLIKNTLAHFLINDDKESSWNNFILLASNLGGEIKSFKQNDTDCIVEINFNKN